MKRSLAVEIADYEGDAKRLALASVIESHGSAPREAGAQMLVYPSGEISGTVGGGPVEFSAIKKAQQLIEEGGNGKYEFEMSNEDAAQAGGICGGRVKIFIETIDINR